MQTSIPIVKLTDKAIAHIQRNIQKQSGSIGLRLSIKMTGCSGFAYVTDIVDQHYEDDFYYKVQDFTVYVDEDAIQYLQGSVMDFVDSGLGQSKLVFQNPNAGNLCGCGESFTLPEK